MRHFSESVDDYLKAILALSNGEESAVPGKALADHLGVRAASVTGMLQKLAAQNPPLVRYVKQHGVRLSPAGRARALEVLRHHRLLERFLHDLLGYGWDEVHEEAERLEHFISERLEDRMAAKLGDPVLDPHGHAIPTRAGAMEPRSETPLTSWACGVPAEVSSVSDREAATLRELARLGIGPGMPITVEAGVRSAGVRVRVGKRRQALALRRRLAAAIRVEPRRH